MPSPSLWSCRTETALEQLQKLMQYRTRFSRFSCTQALEALAADDHADDRSADDSGQVFRIDATKLATPHAGFDDALENPGAASPHFAAHHESGFGAVRGGRQSDQEKIRAPGPAESSPHPFDELAKQGEVGTSMLEEQCFVFAGSDQKAVCYDLIEERGLGSEIVLHRAGADAGAIGNVREGGRLIAPFTEYEGGGIEDLAATFAGAALPAWGWCGFDLVCHGPTIVFI